MLVPHSIEASSTLRHTAGCLHWHGSACGSRYATRACRRPEPANAAPQTLWCV